MNVLWETMIAEIRAERAEADSRRHFTADKQPIELIRHQLAEWTTVPEPEDPEIIVARSATSLRSAAQDDLFEVG